MGVGEKIDINKGNLYKGRGLSGCIDINSKSFEEQRRHGLEKLAAAYRIFAGKGFDLGLLVTSLFVILSLATIFG